mmetsp:Transcript_10266/g.31257  ORF Transcript_10266/g.31257 Transcript_10266/m.31257 type:complete len:227 (+) Transcript_10266:111-791(+)
MPTLYADPSCLERETLVLQVLTACNRSQAGNFDLPGCAILRSKAPPQLLATDIDLYTPVSSAGMPSDTRNSTVNVPLLVGVGYLRHLDVIELGLLLASVFHCKFPCSFDFRRSVVLWFEEAGGPLATDAGSDMPISFLVPTDALDVALTIGIADLDLALLHEALPEGPCIMECLRISLLRALSWRCVLADGKVLVPLFSRLSPQHVPTVVCLAPSYTRRSTLLSLD